MKVVLLWVRHRIEALYGLDTYPDNIQHHQAHSYAPLSQWSFPTQSVGEIDQGYQLVHDHPTVPRKDWMVKSRTLKS
jgi:hypothetical protein